MYTECVGLGEGILLRPSLHSNLEMNHFGECSGLAAAAQNDFSSDFIPYSRYTHGYLILLKPVYSAFPVNSARLVFGLGGACLLAVLFIMARRRLGLAYALALTGSFVFAGTLHVFMLGTHAAQFWVALGGGIAALSTRDTRVPLALFGGIGVSDAYVSFLNMGSLSLGLALLCYCLTMWTDGIPAATILGNAFLAACAWSLGFVLPWLTKWLAVSLFLPDLNIFGQTLALYPARNIRMILSALVTDMKAPLWQPWLILVILLAWRFRRIRARLQPGLWVILFPALMPIIWVALIPGQSGFHHSSFVSIILWPLLAAPILLLLGLPRKAASFSARAQFLPGEA